MKSILNIHIESGKFDHGYLLVGDFESSRKMAFEAAEKILTSLIANPDFFYQKFDLFGIEESRILKEKVSKRPFGESKVFIIELSSFSFESANALLKTMEEPYAGTYFFIIAPSLENILQTLVSRLTVVDNGGLRKELDEEKIKFYKKFLSDLLSKRLETVKKIEEREKAIEFLNELEIVIAKGREKLVSLKTDNKGNLTETQFFSPLNEIQRSRKFLFSQGASAKMVLEHIALTLPAMI